MNHLLYTYFRTFVRELPTDVRKQLLIAIVYFFYFWFNLKRFIHG